jgi:hypothetical protein
MRVDLGWDGNGGGFPQTSDYGTGPRRTYAHSSSDFGRVRHLLREQRGDAVGAIARLCLSIARRRLEARTEAERKSD